MPPRNPELPEGTDHIINGAMETGAGADASLGSSGGGASGNLGGSSTGGIGGGTTVTLGGTSGSTGGAGTASSTGGTAGSGFVASGGGDDTGGTSGGRGGGGSRGTAEKVVSGLRSQVSGLTDQATGKVREYADTGKERATGALDNFAEVINEAARSIDERLGSDYGEYAHRAAGAVTSLSENLRGKTVDQLLEEGRSVVRKSPGIAVGAAAVLGFALVRLVKAGLDDGDKDVEFRPESGRNIEFQPESGGTSGGSA